MFTSYKATLSLPGGMFLEVLEGRGILIGFNVFHISSLSQRVIYNNRLGIGLDHLGYGDVCMDLKARMRDVMIIPQASCQLHP